MYYFDNIIKKHIKLVIKMAASVSTNSEIRTFLIQQKVLPTFEEAQKVFWSRGEEWWKQLIDGKFHQYGRMVFDQGLHERATEPGYLAGIEKASRYFTEHFAEEFSKEMYRNIHHFACAHFRKDEKNEIMCGWDEIDSFRTRTGKSSGYPVFEERYIQVKKNLEIVKTICSRLYNACSQFDEDDDPFTREIYEYLGKKKTSLEDKQKLLAAARSNADRILFKLSDESYPEKTDMEVYSILDQKSQQLQRELRHIVDTIAEQLNTQFVALAKRLGLEKPFIECFRSDLAICVEYNPADRFLKLDQVTEKLISEFNFHLAQLQKNASEKVIEGKDSIEKIKHDYQDAVIPLIAMLYAELEWAHPWIDGQGRTDLIVLNGLLSREGLHPCILDEPYLSTSNLPEVWVNYLKQGLARFESNR